MSPNSPSAHERILITFSGRIPTLLLAVSLTRSDDRVLYLITLMGFITSMNSVIMNAAFYSVVDGALSLSHHDALKASWAFATVSSTVTCLVQGSKQSLQTSIRRADHAFSDLSIILAAPSASATW